MKLHTLIERHWQHPHPLLTALLWPPARLFQAAAWLRRRLYRAGCLKSQRLPVPIVIVGNLHAGGTGKTPITATLVQSLQQRGIRVGIISRGYGRHRRDTHVLTNTNTSTAADAGDEPLLLYRRTGAPVAVSADRADAAHALLAQHPDLQILIGDDGLQHYRLHRDIEIAVYPSADAARRPDLLPNGPLREPLSRLAHTDAVVFSQADNGLPECAFRLPEARFHSRLRIGTPYRFVRPSDTLSEPPPPHAVCAAAAAIARPERFFQSLRDLGIHLAHTHALPDHAALNLRELPPADYVFITEKDAVKLPPDTPENVWVLPVYAIIEPDLGGWLLQRLSLIAPQ